MPTRSGRGFSTPAKAPTAGMGGGADTVDDMEGTPARRRLRPLALHAKPPLAPGIYKSAGLERRAPGKFALMKQEYIERGYRFRLTVRQCFYSLFQLHNEVSAPHAPFSPSPASIPPSKQGTPPVHY